MMKRDLHLEQTGYEVPQLPAVLTKQIAKRMPYDGIVHEGLFYRGAQTNFHPRVLMIGNYDKRDASEDELFAVRRGIHLLLGESQRPANLIVPDNTSLDNMTPYDLGIVLGLPHANDVKERRAA